MWAFIANLRTIDKDPFQKLFKGERTEPRILNFNKQKSQKGARRKSFGLIVINNCLRDFLFVPLYSFNLNSVSKLLVWSGTLPHKKK